MLPSETLRYLIRFIAQSDLPSDAVGYTSDSDEALRYKVCIRPSRFFAEGVFGTRETLPTLPAKEVDGVPVLFGGDTVSMNDGRVVTDADIVASAFFVMTRYEETIVDERDQHGRFGFKNSVLSSEQLRFRAVVDEYGRVLRKWLRMAGVSVEEPEARLSSVTLTHDVDILTAYRRWRGLMGGLTRMARGSRETLGSMLGALTSVERDPVFGAFERLVEIDNRVEGARKLYFIKSAIEAHAIDRPTYDLRGRDFVRLKEKIGKNGAELGLHTSYFAGARSEMIPREKQRLEEALEQSIDSARYHYLRTCSIDNFRVLAQCGVTDEYTMGFADAAAFRLGTSRIVRWIDPESRLLTPLRLHPLTMMDCTLSGENYMDLTASAALEHAKRLIDTTREHGGDLCLLWHNNSLVPFLSSFDHATLYTQVIDYIGSCSRQ